MPVLNSSAIRRRSPSTAFKRSLFSTQIPFFNGVWGKSEDVSRAKMNLVHRRGGKTEGEAMSSYKDFNDFYGEQEIFNLRGRIDSYDPVVVYFAPTKEQGRRVFWPYVKRYLGNIKGVKLNAHTLTATLPRKHLGDEIKLYILPSKKHDSARGLKIRKAYIDEFQDAPPEAWPQSISPALKDTLGEAMITGTVKGQDHLFELYKLFIAQGTPTYVYPVTRTEVFNKKEILKFRAEDIRGSFFREYMMDFWAEVDGAFFAETLRELERDSTLNMFNAVYDPELPVILGVDIGLGDGFAAWVAQITPGNKDGEGRAFNLLDFYEGYYNLNDFKNDLKEDGYAPDLIYLPHDGKTAVTSAYKKTTNRDIYRQVFPQAVIKVCERPPNKLADIDNVTRHLHLIRIPERGTTGTDAWKGYFKLKQFSLAWDENLGRFKDSIDKKTKADHCADALRTLVTGVKCKDGKIIRLPMTQRRNQRIEIPAFEQRILGHQGNLMDRIGRFERASNYQFTGN